MNGHFVQFETIYHYSGHTDNEYFEITQKMPSLNPWILVNLQRICLSKKQTLRH